MAEVLGFDFPDQDPPASGSLDAGAFCVLQASPGAGASAWLRALAGLNPCPRGRIRLGGAPVIATAYDHPFRAAGRLGWVPSEGGLMANLDLLANVALPLRWHQGLSAARARDAARPWLERAGLGEALELRPHAVSPQEGWLATLARCAATPIALALVDRPPSELETRQATTARDLLGACLDRGCAVLTLEGPWQPERPHHTWVLSEGRVMTEAHHGL